MPFALSALCGKVLHQILISVTHQIVVRCTVATEIEIRVFEHTYQPAQRLNQILSFTEFLLVTEIRHIDYIIQSVRFGERSHFLIHLFTDIAMAFQCDEIVEKTTVRNFNHKVRISFVFIANVFHEENNQYIIFVLAGIHTSAQFIATFPKGAI